MSRPDFPETGLHTFDNQWGRINGRYFEIVEMQYTGATSTDGHEIVCFGVYEDTPDALDTIFHAWVPDEPEVP